MSARTEEEARFTPGTYLRDRWGSVLAWLLAALGIGMMTARPLHSRF